MRTAAAKMAVAGEWPLAWRPSSRACCSEAFWRRRMAVLVWNSEACWVAAYS